jgi:hypothetical protein
MRRKSLRHSLLLNILLWPAAMIFGPQPVAAATDVVEFRNGDRLSGDAKSLDRGRLAIETDATGTIYVEWNEVAYLSIDENRQVEVEGGQRYFGKLLRADDAEIIVVETDTEKVELPVDLVIGIYEIDETGFRNLDLNVSLGYNFTKASNVTQFNASADTAYRTRKRIFAAALASSISDSSNNDVSQRQSLDFTYTRLRANQWLNDGGISFDRNDELGLNLRTSLYGGLGRYLVHTNNSIFSVTGGLKATREDSDDEPNDVDSLESYGIVTWQWFRYDSPELDWSTSLEIIPSLTESGRVRGEFDATLSWEIVNDFYWQLEFYDSYDNKPQSSATTSNDYGVTTSISYKF